MLQRSDISKKFTAGSRKWLLAQMKKRREVAESGNNFFSFTKKEDTADIDDVPKEVRSKINFIPVKSMDTVLENALR